MEKTKVDLMGGILNKLEDIKNSQNSLIEKIGSIEVDLFNCPDEELENSMNNILSLAAEASDIISSAIEDYTMALNRLKTQ
jgi:hypothetical protein